MNIDIRDKLSFLYQKRYYLNRFVYTIEQIAKRKENSQLGLFYGLYFDTQYHASWSVLIIDLADLVGNKTTDLTILTLLKDISKNLKMTKEVQIMAKNWIGILKNHSFYEILQVMRNNYIAHTDLEIPFKYALGEKVSHAPKDCTLEQMKEYFSEIDSALSFIDLAHQISPQLLRNDVIKSQNFDRFQQQVTALFEKLQK